MSSDEKDYIVFYRSEEHYEILGFVRAKSLREAILKAKRQLKEEAVRYSVVNATIAEIPKCSEILFD